MKVIVDANLWISFTIGKRLSVLKTLLNDKRLAIYICDELIEEYKRVVIRPKFKKYIQEKDILETLELMTAYCQYIKIRKHSVSAIRDSKDLFLLSLADTISADYIVSGDKDLLVLGKHNKTMIMDYKTFIDSIGL